MKGIFTTILTVTAVALLLLNPSSFASAAENETVFIQDDETYPAHIVPDRIALILSDTAMADAERYRKTLDSLGGRRIPTLSDAIVEVEVPDAKDAKSLNAAARDLMKSWPDLVVDSGILVRIGNSDLPYVLTDKIVVQIADDADVGLIQTIAEQYHCEILGNNPFDKRQFVIRLLPDSAKNTLEVSNALNRLSGIKFAHPNFYRPIEKRQAPPAPNDPFYSDQWHLNNTGQAMGTPDADIDADGAWSLGPMGSGNPNIVIAIIDDGLEANHPDLAAGLWTNHAEQIGSPNVDDDGNGFIDDLHGWDFTPCITPVSCGDNDVRPRLDQLHGTAVAGVALARKNNSIGVVGTCPRCSFLPIRALDGTDYAESLAIDYAKTIGADIISLSWGYASGVVLPTNVVNSINSAATTGRVQNGVSKGIIVVVAMTDTVEDNCDGTPDLSSLANVIAVSSATNQDQRLPAGFGTCMDLLAPTHGGTLDAVTTDRIGDIGYNNRSPVSPCASAEPAPPPPSNRDYTFCFGGTSFAAPVVAGIAGLLLSHDNSLTRLQVQRLLQDTADKISPSSGAYSEQTGSSTPVGGLPTHGFGRVNAFEAARTVAGRDIFGRGGVDVYVRDNSLDWGNTEQPSNVTFEQTRGFIPHWQSVDIKVDAPPYSATQPISSTEFDAFIDENPLSNTLNRVYVRIHNRGTQTATDVQVKLHWAFAGAGLPALPADFWPAFPANSTDVSIWHPLPAQTIPSLPYSGASVAGNSNDNSIVLPFDFAAPVYNASVNNPDHFCLFLVVTAPDDPVSTVSVGPQVPDLITPSDNNVTQKNLHLVDSGNSSGLRSQLIVSNPFDYPINTRLVAWRPKDWNVESSGVEMGKRIELGAKESLPVEISIMSHGQPSASINIVQLYQASDMKEERILGGMTYVVAPGAQPAVVPSPGYIENVGAQEKLIAEYLKLVADTISKPDVRGEDRTLLHRLSILIEEQGKLLAGVEAARKGSRSDH
ncbi:peptidase S8/S53 family subtilisin-related protein [Rhizobium etli 8C-3]|uniref:Peptidase S8/S53 family subtilisin-related protein n=1 Tax=Rhizobium etli 8C-3 TaxID=538025 RepID=A0A1L5P809_RHIET|nr:S8 family serine peptidase [Rhizobium etli]APO76260.1 peptidase S8/S53 family subtilisin-related protein [Rhizobium etli 8C-3]